MRRWLTSILCALLLLAVLVSAQDVRRRPIVVGGGCTTPACVSSVKLWLKADALVLSDNDPVATWADSSGNGNDVTEATDRPIFKTNIVNSLPAVRFNGTNQRLISSWAVSNILTASAYTAYVVFSATAIDTNAANVYENDPGWADSDGYAGLFLKSAPTAHAYNFDGSVDDVSVAISTATWTLIQTRHESGNLYIRKNNGSDSSVASGDTSVLTGTFRLGLTTSAAYSGDIAEVIICNNASAGDIAIIQAYIGTKYALF